MKNGQSCLRAGFISVVLAAGGLLGSCATPMGEKATAEEALTGEVHTARFVIAEDERIVVEEDVHIVAEEDVVIRGELLGRHGATITITASSIAIHGTLRAGDGENRDGVLESGQNGGNVILNAPYIDLAGSTLAAGRGGNAGPAGNGGNGGSIMLNDVISVQNAGAQLHGGKAGRGGAGINDHGEAARRGGDGGDGGGMRIRRAGQG